MGFLKALILFLGLLGIGFYAMIVALFRYGDPKLNQIFTKPFGKFAQAIVGIKLQILNEDRLQLARPAVVIGNHQTGLDLGLISWACPEGSVIVAKKQIKSIPIFGWFFGAAGNLYIDRSKPIEAKRQMTEMIETLKKKNLNLAIFPEGTRNRGAPGMLPFKKGAFHLAVNTGFPLIPVVCSSLKGKAIWEDFELSGGKVLISVLEPMQTAHLKPNEVFEFQSKVHALMLAEFHRLNAIIEAEEAKG